MVRKQLIVGFALLSVTYGIVCTPDYCQNVTSEVTPETCEEQGLEYRPNSSFCGCSATCIQYADVGEPCGASTKFLPIRGGPPQLQKHCRPGTKCVCRQISENSDDVEFQCIPNTCKYQ